MLEAVLFASRAPLTGREIAERLPQGCDIGEALAGLRRRYEGRGVQLARVGDAWAFRTAADLGFLMSREVVETRKLSRAAIETLAIVAYHQPVTRAEIEAIRGVSLARFTLDRLIEAGWVRPAGRRETPGRPLTWATTPQFLAHFCLDSLKDLPDIDELRAAGLLDIGPSALGEAAAAEYADSGQAEQEGGNI